MARPVPTFDQLKDEYRHLWQTIELKSSKQSALAVTANKIINGHKEYLKVEMATGVPWWWVGITHAMESGCNFSTHLHNGDSLKARTKLVPKGRPLKGNPPFEWFESAMDALMMKDLHKIKDWDDPARVAFEFERYNGFGYRRYHPEVLSPYLWSYTSHYVRGKYVADGKWSGTAVSAQSGAMALLKTLIDAGAINPFGQNPVPEVPPVEEFEDAIVAGTDIKPTPANPSLWQRIKAWFA